MNNWRIVHRQRRSVRPPNKCPWTDNKTRHRPPPHKASLAEKKDSLKAAKEEEQYTPPPAPSVASLPSNMVPCSVEIVEPCTTMAPCGTIGQELRGQLCSSGSTWSSHEILAHLHSLFGAGYTQALIVPEKQYVPLPTNDLRV